MNEYFIQKIRDRFYVKIEIRIENSVEIPARYLKPRKFSSKFKVVMDEIFKSRMNDGENGGAVHFFSDGKKRCNPIAQP